MEEWIKKDSALEICDRWRRRAKEAHDRDGFYIANIIHEQTEELIDARPQGEWIKFGLGRGTRIIFCTNCERRIEVPLSQGDSNYDFCPNCGARMKGAGDDI